jgi:hypothetical protein
VSIATAGTLALAGGVAWAGSPNIVAMDDFFGNPTYEIPEGGQATLDNQGPNNTHNVTANEDGPDGGPLFRSGNVTAGQSRTVGGTRFLSAGSYGFFCSIHPQMEATLSVINSASGPLPRPAISLKVKSKKLAKVVKSGKLKVKVSAAEPTDADGVSLTAKKGRKSITKKANLDVDAGGSKTAKLKLKKNAASKLADLDKAKVKVEGTVDFGFGDKASKKLK